MRSHQSSTTHDPGERLDAQGFAHQLVPLELATRLIGTRLYGRSSISDQRLAGIAHTIAALVPLYVYSRDGSDLRRLRDDEVLGGLFRNKGGELHFTDGRAPIRNLAVAHQAIEEVTQLLGPQPAARMAEQR